MKKKIIFTSIIAFIIISINIISNGAIEIKEGTKRYHTTASGAYDLCYALRNNDTTLGTNNLDPHLALNKDWGAFAYLAMSSYGTVRSKYGEKTNINGTEYYSTTGNATGVIVNGDKYYMSYTAGILDGATNEYITSLVNNKDTKYVEKFSKTADASTTKGQALFETNGWYDSSSNYFTTTGVVLARNGVAGYVPSKGDKKASSSSSSYYWYTFRPVIWNK